MAELTGRDQEAVSRFVERFGSALAESGMARMPARIFAALLATDSGRLTAAEIADVLQVSPAAVSGAVRYLTQLSLITREREPGSRRDYYSMRDDVWYEASIRKEHLWSLWEQTLSDGISALGPDSPAGERLAESLEFFRFFHREMPTLLERWREYRDKWAANR